VPLLITLFFEFRDDNTGTKTDILTRKDNIKTNSYNVGNGYGVPSDDAIGSNTINLS
jgi:hypothetical protein